MYILLKDNKVQEIIPDFDPTFPDIPIAERYPAKFIEKLLYVDDDTEVEQNMLYNSETGTFSEPPAPDPVPEPQPEPTPEPAPQTLDDQLTAAIEKGLSL